MLSLHNFSMYSVLRSQEKRKAHHPPNHTSETSNMMTFSIIGREMGKIPIRIPMLITSSLRLLRALLP